MQYTYIHYITRWCNFIHISVEFAFENVSNGERLLIYCCSGYHGGNNQYNTIKQIRYVIWKWHEITWHCQGKVPLPLSGVYISNGHYDRMSQLRTMVLSIHVKWSMTCNITIIQTPLVVARHRELSLVDYRDENGHSMVDLSNMCFSIIADKDVCLSHLSRWTKEKWSRNSGRFMYNYFQMSTYNLIFT